MPTKKKGPTHRVETGGSGGSRASRSIGHVAVANATVDPKEELGHVEGVIGLEFKPKLSEAVMQACGLHRGYAPDTQAGDDDESHAVFGRARALADATEENLSDDDEVIVDNRDQDGAIFLPAPESPADCLELKDVQNYLAAKYGGYIERTKRKQAPKSRKGAKVDRVTIKMTYGEDAEVVTGVGKNNPEALKALCAKLGESGFAVFASDEQEAD